MDPWNDFFAEVESDGTTYDRIRVKALELIRLKDTHPAPEWMRYLDAEDRALMVREMLQGIHALRHTPGGGLKEFREMMRAWRITGEQLADPVRRAVLLKQELPQESSE